MQVQEIKTKAELEALPPGSTVILQTPGNEGGEWWLAEGAGYTDTEDEAFEYPVEHQIVQNMIGSLLTKLYLVVKEPAPPADPNAPKRLSSLRQFLTAEAIKLLEAAPNHPSVRAMVLAKVGKEPPPEVITAEQLRNWVEFNFAGPVALKPLKDPFRPGIAGRPRPGLEIQMDWTGTESGRCIYTRGQVASCTPEFSLDDIEAAIENTDDIGGVLNNLVAMELDDIDYGIFESDDNGCNYSDHESQDGVTDIEGGPRNRIRSFEQLREFIRIHLPDAYAELTGDEPNGGEA